MGKDTLDQSQTAYFDKVYDAVCESIGHWKRICAYIKAEMYDEADSDDIYSMEDKWRWNYGETMHGHSCPLCKIYRTNCDICVLKKKGHECDYEGSHWYRTISSESLPEMLENAQRMVKFLENVKHELVEER